MNADLIFDGPRTERARVFLNNLRVTAPVGVRAVASYTGQRSTIILYGAGDPKRSAYLARHLQNPKNHAFLWDLGYWDRQDSMRLSLDGMHPRPEHLAASPTESRRAFNLREDADPDGPVMLVGLGVKTNRQHGWEINSWEQRKLRWIREKWPGVKVIHRLKRPGPHLEGCEPSVDTPITEALKGVRAVVCKHSNVGVDACVAGVPVYTEDGAAWALYHDNPEPSRAERKDFLHRLSWWEWSRHESRTAWQWMQRWIE